MDGSWNVTMMDGETPESGESYTMTFTKDKKDNGAGTMNYTDGSFTFGIVFTYTLADDKLTMTVDGEPETVTITKYEKDAIEWTNSDGEKTVLEAK
ncbi:MAG: lipocalin family protein [Bacteroidota bacterium]